VSLTGRLQTFGRDDAAVVGGKAANLGELVRAGQPVPPGFVITTESYQTFVAANGLADVIAESRTDGLDDEAFRSASMTITEGFVGGRIDPRLRRAILAAYGRIGRGAVAVRSSATAEDLPEASFAGQQDSYLNVHGDDALLDAIRRCWASLWTARAMAYRARRAVDTEDVQLAVIVQRLVDAEAAGVMFTANPSNGRRTQTMINAAWGLGEAVVSGSVNPDQLVLDTDAGRMISSQVADKAVMTVLSSDGTEERPVPEDRRRAAVLDEESALSLARLGTAIADHFGAPQDIEWARSGGEFLVLQSRPITALPLPEADPPTEWLPPREHTVYVRASIVEQLPDPLTPLFADLIDDSVARSLEALFGDLLEKNPVHPGDVGLPTINGYAYYGYDNAAMRRMVMMTPRALGVLRSGGPRSGTTRWRETSHPRYRRLVRSWSGRPLQDLTSGELLSGVRELLDAGTEYYTAVQAVIPVAALSELIFTRMYAILVRRRDDPPAATFLLGFDSEPIRAEKSLYDLAQWAGDRPGVRDRLLHDSTEETLASLPSTPPEDLITEEAAPEGATPVDATPDETSPADAGSDHRGGEHGEHAEDWDEFSRRLQQYLSTYGHAVYNLDFANPVPADDPSPLLDALRFYLRGGGQSPHERQHRLAERREHATAAVRARLDPARLAMFDRLLAWAQSTGPVREDALADVGLAWPEIRRMLRELGRRAVERGVIDQADDVFWLHWSELRQSLTPSEDLPRSLSAEIEARQELWRGRKRASPPQWLPRGTWMDVMEKLLPATTTEQTGSVLVGIGGSAGTVAARARVLAGPEDFARFEPGEILVASITTPAWTSLFSRAAGVVTDIGGPLSHSSIVAREYGIPAVLGTNVATRRIVSGTKITVDGDAGKVYLPTAVGDTPDSIAPNRRPPRVAVAVAAVTAVGGVAAAVGLGMRHRARRQRARR
jgi:rifampicin phosphotransferase